MDLYNNELGKQIAQQAKSRADVERIAVQMMPKAMVIHPPTPGEQVPLPTSKQDSFHQGFQEESAKLKP